MPSSPIEPPESHPLPARQTPLVSLLLALVCVVTFTYQLLRFGWLPSTSELHVIGALTTGSLEAGNWWALGMHQLLHADASHLISNLFLLLVIGILVEIAWGWGITALVMVAGAVGSAVATIIVHPTDVAVGASGIIAGLAGFGLLQYAPPRANRRALQIVAACTIALQAASYFALRAFGDDQIDVVNDAAHLGGLAGGLLVAIVLRPARMRTPRVLRQARRLGAVLAAVLLVATFAGATPRVVDVSRYAWRGVGSNPDPTDVPPIPLVELALTGRTVPRLGTLVAPECEVDADDVNAVSCTSRVRNGGDKLHDFRLDRSAEQLAFDIVLTPTKSRASEAFVRELPNVQLAFCDEIDDGLQRFECRGLAGDVPVFGQLRYNSSGDVSVTTDEVESTEALVRHVGIERTDGSYHPGRVVCDEVDCAAIAYGHWLPIKVTIADEVIHVEYVPNQLIGSPSTSAGVSRLLEGRSVQTYFGAASIDRVRHCAPGAAARDWNCSVVMGGGERTDTLFSFGFGYRFHGTGGVDVLATKYPPVAPPDLEELARRVPETTVAAIERRLRGRTFTYVSGTGATKVRSASCTKQAPRTTDPDFTCRIRFVDGTTEDHGVEPDPLQSVPLNVIQPKRPKEYVTVL